MILQYTELEQMDPDMVVYNVDVPNAFFEMVAGRGFSEAISWAKTTVKVMLQNFVYPRATISEELWLEAMIAETKQEIEDAKAELAILESLKPGVKGID